MTDGQSTTSSSAEVEGYVHQQPPTSSVRHQHDDHQRQHQDQSVDVDADVDADGSPIEHDDDDGPPPPPPQFFPHPDSVSSIAHHHGITSGDKSSRWSARDDVLLCDGLVRQQDLGRCRNLAVFSIDAWEAVAEALKGSEFVSGGAPKTVAQCKARWQRLKTEFRIVRHIRQQPGFGWDEATQMVVAPNEVWDAYVANHHDASPWRKKSYPCYSRMSYLIEDDEGHDKGDAKFRRRWEANISRRGTSPGTRAAVRKALKEAQAQAKLEERAQAKVQTTPNQKSEDPVSNARRASARILNYGKHTNVSVTDPPPFASPSASSSPVPVSVPSQVQGQASGSTGPAGGSTSIFPVINIRSEHNGTKFVNRFAPVGGGPVTTNITTTATSSPGSSINSALHQLRLTSPPQANGKRPHSPVGEQSISKRVNHRGHHGGSRASGSSSGNRPIAPSPRTPTHPHPHAQHAPPPPQHNYTPGTIIYTTQAPPPPPSGHGHPHSHSHAPVPVPSNANYFTIPAPPPSSGTPQPYGPTTVTVHQIPIGPGPSSIPLPLSLPLQPPPGPPSQPQQPQQSGPTRLAEAIQVLESTFSEDGFSESQFIKAVRIFERRSEAADAYLAIQSRRARRLFLKAELEELESGGGGSRSDGKGAGEPMTGVSTTAGSSTSAEGAAHPPPSVAMGANGVGTDVSSGS